MKFIFFTLIHVGFQLACVFSSKIYNSNDLEIWQKFFNEANMRNSQHCNDDDTFNDPCSSCNAEGDPERPHIKCTKAHHEFYIAEIILMNNDLSGTLKTSLSGLKHIKHIDLRGNHELSGLGPEGCIQEGNFCGNSVNNCKLGAMACLSDDENDSGSTPTSRPTAADDTSSEPAPTPRPSASTNEPGPVSQPNPDNAAEAPATAGQKFVAFIMVFLLFFPGCLSVAAFRYNQQADYESEEYLERIGDDHRIESTKPQWQWTSNSFRLDRSSGSINIDNDNGLSHRIGAAMGQTNSHDNPHNAIDFI